MIPLGQPWTDVYHQRPPLSSVMISVDLVSKSDGSMITVLEYVGNSYDTHVLDIMIDDKNEIRSFS